MCHEYNGGSLARHYRMYSKSLQDGKLSKDDPASKAAWNTLTPAQVQERAKGWKQRAKRAERRVRQLEARLKQEQKRFQLPDTEGEWAQIFMQLHNAGKGPKPDDGEQSDWDCLALKLCVYATSASWHT